jgi:hypothetical protein
MSRRIPHTLEPINLSEYREYGICTCYSCMRKPPLKKVPGHIAAYIVSQTKRGLPDKAIAEGIDRQVPYVQQVQLAMGLRIFCTRAGFHVRLKDAQRPVVTRDFYG